MLKVYRAFRFCARKLTYIISAAALLLSMASVSPVHADEPEDWEAADLTKDSAVVITGGGAAASTLTDGNPNTFVSFVDDGEVTVTAPSGQMISALYVVWRGVPEEWTVEAGGRSYAGGENGFLHETVKLDEPVAEAVLRWEYRQAYLADIHILGEGTLPDWVQQWEAPEGPADLLLFPTHADDEHLYFGGAMPYYASRGDTIIQVCYMVNHNGEPYRLHEQLDGLWTAGVRRYPVIPEFPDIYSNSLSHAKTVYDREEILAYETEMIRRFQPMVVIGHDLKGEYGHGAHMLNADCLTEVIEKTGDPDYFPESYEAYGGWQASKLYLHLYDQNQIIMEWGDMTLASPFFQGQTALEAAIKAFDCHVSQQEWFQVTASGLYDCRKFGLYYTNVGLDEAGNDFFEHLELPRLASPLDAPEETPPEEALPEEVLPVEPEQPEQGKTEEPANNEPEKVLPVTEPALLPEDDRPTYSLRMAAWAAGGISLGLFVILFLVGRVKKNRSRLGTKSRKS